MTILSCGEKTLKFTVLGTAVPQKRPRFSFKTHKAYEPKESKDYKSNINAMATIAVQEQHWNICHREMPVAVRLTIYRSIPSGMPQWKKRAARYGYFPPLTRNSDIDNIAKVVLDAMAGIVYEDDAQVFKLDCESRYGEQPRVEVEVIGYFTNIGEIKDKINAEIRKEKREGKAKK